MRNKRRHHEERMKAKARKIAVEVRCMTVGNGYTKQHIENFVKNHNNLQICSCSMCGNPRRSKWKEKTRKEKDNSWKDVDNQN
jgi:hypothetical protein